MSEPFLGQIDLFSFDFAPKGWALCNGQLLPINQNQALFALLGTMYGGDGRVTFALPNLQGRVPLHLGNGHVQGESAGEASHTLTQSESPTHVHSLNATPDLATVGTASGNLLAQVDNTTFGSAYAGPSGLAAMAPNAISTVGGSQAHENRQPFLTLNFCIALVGIFPSQN